MVAFGAAVLNLNWADKDTIELALDISAHFLNYCKSQILAGSKTGPKKLSQWLREELVSSSLDWNPLGVDPVYWFNWCLSLETI